MRSVSSKVKCNLCEHLGDIQSLWLNRITTKKRVAASKILVITKLSTVGEIVPR